MTAIATVRARYGRALVAAGAVLAVVLVWLGWTWFRDSSIVRVRHVQISGVASGPDAAAIRAELRQAAGEMTTLHVRAGQARARGFRILDRALGEGERQVPEHPADRGARARPRRALEGARRQRRARRRRQELLPHVPKGKLPAVGVATSPTHDGFATPRVRTLVRVVAGAPAQLRPQVARAYLGKDGILVGMRDGTTLELGTPARLPAKWAAATRVLAAPSASGADTIDVRLPERPAARGFGSG